LQPAYTNSLGGSLLKQ